MSAKRTQKILSYFAIFEPIARGGYTVSFPDFSGCVTFGESFEDAKEKAHEVLQLWLEELRSAKEAIPDGGRRPIIDEVRVTLSRR